MRPFLSGRDYHGMQRENASFDFTTTAVDGTLRWRPYGHVPAIVSASTGRWRDDPQWYRNFLYTVERERGLDDIGRSRQPGRVDVRSRRRERRFGSSGTSDDLDGLPSGGELVRAVDARMTPSVIAARASPIALPGPPTRTSCSAALARPSSPAIRGSPTGAAIRSSPSAASAWRPADSTEARDILLEWANTVSEGMLPNRFPDGGEAPEYNAVDASLWYVVATASFCEAATRRPGSCRRSTGVRLESVIVTVLEGLARGTRYGIRADGDGLLACGAPGVQLTWMDARVGDRVITPRTGKPVEIQALWINALEAGARLSTRWGPVVAHARAIVRAPLLERGRPAACTTSSMSTTCRGTSDAAIRPNQILRGGRAAASGAHRRCARDVSSISSKRELLTPLGLRTLSPREPAMSDTTRAVRRFATTAITRARPGRGCSARSSMRGSSARRGGLGQSGRALTLPDAAARAPG